MGHTKLGPPQKVAHNEQSSRIAHFDTLGGHGGEGAEQLLDELLRDPVLLAFHGAENSWHECLK